MCGISSCSIAVMKWLVRPIGRIVLRQNGLIVEFWQQLALWVALCVVIIAIFFFSSSTLFHLGLSVSCTALSLCFCFFRLLAVAISLLWRLSRSKRFSGMMNASSSGLCSSPEAG